MNIPENLIRELINKQKLCYIAISCTNPKTNEKLTLTYTCKILEYNAELQQLFLKDKFGKTLIFKQNEIERLEEI